MVNKIRFFIFFIGVVIMLALTGPIMAQGPINPEHSDPLWQATYWNNSTLSGPPIMRRVETDLDFDWGYGSPEAIINPDRFSARWTRYIYVAPGNYRFTVTTDDGLRLWVDDTLIIDRWQDQPPTTYTAQMYLEAGHHLLKVEYYENMGVATAQLNWDPPGEPPTPTPPAAGSVGFVTSQKLNIRSGPGLNYRVVGWTYKDEPLILFGRNNGSTWLKVRTKRALEGWVYAAYIYTHISLTDLPVLDGPPLPQPAAIFTATPTPTPPVWSTAEPNGLPDEDFALYSEGHKLKSVPLKTGPVIDLPGSTYGVIELTPLDPPACCLAVDPAGERLAFATCRTMTQKVYVQPLDSSGLKAISSLRINDGDGPCPDPAWSPDGRQLAFVNYDYSLYVVNADGTQLTRLEPAGRDPTWSPDGQQIAFTALHSQKGLAIAVMNRDGRNSKLLTAYETRDQRPAWSPDGRQIAFVSQRDGNQEIYLMHRDGSHQRRLTYHEAQDWGPVWSPDGWSIVFTSDRNSHNGIYVIKRINGDGAAPKWLMAADVPGRWPMDTTRVRFIEVAK